MKNNFIKHLGVVTILLSSSMALAQIPSQAEIKKIYDETKTNFKAAKIIDIEDTAAKGIYGKDFVCEKTYSNHRMFSSTETYNTDDEVSSVSFASGSPGVEMIIAYNQENTTVEGNNISEKVVIGLYAHSDAGHYFNRGGFWDEIWIVRFSNETMKTMIIESVVSNGAYELGEPTWFDPSITQSNLMSAGYTTCSRK